MRCRRERPFSIRRSLDDGSPAKEPLSGIRADELMAFDENTAFGTCLAFVANVDRESDPCTSKVRLVVSEAEVVLAGLADLDGA